MKKLLLTCFAVFTAASAFAQVTMSGKVVDAKGEPIPNATIAVLKNGVMKTGVQADFDGLYRMTGLDPGKYDVQCSSIGFATQLQKGVQLTTGLVPLNFKLDEDTKLLGTVTIVEYKIPIVKVDQTTQGQQFTSDQIRALPMKDVNSIVATTAGVSSTQGEKPTIKGSRSDGTNYYIDGIRVGGTNTVPVNEIEQLQVITGGLESKYGDVTGGIISITTKGPARKFTGGVELETSQYLDPYGYNFGNANVSGPLWQRTVTNAKGVKSDETVLGFRLSGQVRDRKSVV